MFVDAFLANYALHGDFAKASRFAVLIFPPPGLTNAGGLFGGLIGQNAATQALGRAHNVASLTFQVESAILPGYQVNTVDQTIYGAKFTSPATPVFEELNLSIICAGDLWERKYFEDWMEIVLPREPSKSSVKDSLTEIWKNDSTEKRAPFTASYRDQYTTTIEVVHFHETGIPSARYKFVEAYPTLIASQPLSWDSGGAVEPPMRLQVRFDYRTYTREENILKTIWSSFKPGEGTIDYNEALRGT